MTAVVGIGADPRLDGFALAGVPIIGAASASEVAEAWAGLAADVGLVILTAEAACELAPMLADRPDLLTVELP